MWEAGNSLSKLFGHENKNPWQSQGHLPYDVQQTNAWNLRSALLTKTAQVLEANRGGANYAWPSNIPGVGGQKVSSETVSNLVHHVYPSWDPGSILKAVAENKTATGEERASLQAKSPTYLPLYDNFIKASNQIGSLISKDSITNTAALADATVKMRKAAYELSMQDSSFYNFYKKYYQSKFGPLEEIK